VRRLLEEGFRGGFRGRFYKIFYRGGFIKYFTEEIL
jgi:hypothetical protein